MNPKPKYFDDDCAGKLAFMGKISSSVTHELNNVFSIINEYAGVIEDKIYAAMNGAEFDVDKVMVYKEKIVEQISRGKKLNKNLNGFSHNADDAEIEFELTSAMENFVALTKRTASLKEISLEFAAYHTEVFMKGDLFSFEKRLFAAMTYLLEFAPAGSAMKIIAENKNVPCVTIASKFAGAEFEDIKSGIENLSGGLLENVSQNAEPDSIYVQLKFQD